MSFLQKTAKVDAEPIFKALDKDGSGFISFDEFKQIRMTLSKNEVDAIISKVWIYTNYTIHYTHTVTSLENNPPECWSRLLPWKGSWP